MNFSKNHVQDKISTRYASNVNFNIFANAFAFLTLPHRYSIIHMNKQVSVLVCVGEHVKFVNSPLVKYMGLNTKVQSMFKSNWDIVVVIVLNGFIENMYNLFQEYDSLRPVLSNSHRYDQIELLKVIYNDVVFCNHDLNLLILSIN